MFSKTIALFVLTLSLAGYASAQKFYADDPLMVDNDRIIDAGHPKTRKLSDYYDFLEHMFSAPGDQTRMRALNVNSLDEVPDSSWFQNRHGVSRMTIQELVRGPNNGPGPSLDGPWLVTNAKTEGVTPGFSIRDARGDAYVIKFDPPANPEMATAAEIISTKFFHAAGYNVPENYLVFFSKSRLQVDSSATITDALGKRRPMTSMDLDRILEKVYHVDDQRYRALASKFISGQPIGPFKYHGTRSDDPNDVVPHEHRRELRGMRVLAAWLNHDDSRAINTLDSVQVQDDGRGYVRHYLIDFGSTLGSGSVTAQKPRAGWEYLWEPAPALKRIVSLGLWDLNWIHARYPSYRSVGRLESRLFDPTRWKPEYPNPAFSNAQRDDSYWAAKIVMAFSDEDIRAIVNAGGLSDPEAERYLADTLIERRNKIGRAYLGSMLPLDRFTVDSELLRFENVGERFRIFESPVAYTLQWFRFDNQNGRKTFVSEPVVTTSHEVALPADLRGGDVGHFGVEIRSGTSLVCVFVAGGSSPRIVGIERGWDVD